MLAIFQEESMKPRSAGVLLLGTLAAVAMLLLSGPAPADPPIWANAKWVKATYTECGRLRYLILKGDSVNVPAPPSSPGCTSTEEIYHQLNVSKKFFRPENKGQLSESHVDAGYIFCGKGEAAIILGPAGDTERANREHPAPPGCTYTRRKYQYVSSVGSIPFTNVANGGTMTVAESLAMHAKERERAIAECNASAACQAEVRRMSSFSGGADPTSPRCPSGLYDRYDMGSCVDHGGNPAPNGDVVPRY
jgi:hypothetical protein